MSVAQMHKHLRDRHFNAELYPSVAVTSDVVTFPLWNLSGSLVGYQRYNPSGNKKSSNPADAKYFTYISKYANKPAITAFGLELLNPQCQTIVLVEGVFKACRFHNYGVNALATLSNDPKHLMSWLHSLGYTVVAVCDGDEAGKKLAKFGNSAILLPDKVYVDEMSEDEFKFLLYELKNS